MHMETRKLAGLEPAAVFHYFEEICAIPHGSYHTKAISDYLVDNGHNPFAKYFTSREVGVIIDNLGEP